MRFFTVFSFSALLSIFCLPALLSALQDENNHWWRFGDASQNGFWDPVYALSTFDGGLIAGGEFSYVGGNPGDGLIARWDGDRWQQLGDGLGWNVNQAGYYPFVFDVAVYRGELIAAGRFQYANGWLGGIRVNNIARWDGTSWHPLGSGLSDNVFALTVYDSTLIAAGYFTSAGGLPADYVARWNGNSWQAMPGLNGNPVSFAEYEGDLIACGSFNQAGGRPAPRIARWDGNEWTPFGSREIDFRSDLIVYQGRLVANAYYYIGGFQWLLVSYWNGEDWTPLGTGVSSYCGAVESFAIYNDQLFAAGNFNGLGGDLNNIARWDGARWNPLGSGVEGTVLEGTVRDLEVHAASLYVGGRFQIAGGGPSWFIARWDDEITPVTIQDFSALSTPSGVQLAWRLPSIDSETQTIHVQRAESSPETFETISDRPLRPQPEMTFLDDEVESGKHYWYRLVFRDLAGVEEFAGLIDVVFFYGAIQQTFLGTPTVAGSGQQISVPFSIASASPIDLSIYDVRGRLVRTLTHETFHPGQYIRHWNGADRNGARTPRGIYFIHLQAAGLSQTRKLPLLHK